MAENQRRTDGNRTGASAKALAQKRSKRKLIIFALEIAIILVMVGVLYLVVNATSGEGPKVTVLDPEKLAIPPEIQQAKEEGESPMVGYMNIALFGVDATSADKKDLYKKSRSDCIMIASVNLATGDVKLLSVYRDTLLNIGTDKYKKANTAYAAGGAEQAIKMLNMNLDMDIEKFVTVGYTGLSEVIDGLGGVWIEVDSTELNYINDYQSTIAKDLWGNPNKYEPVTETGYQLLNGVQASAYCRIRYGGGSDFKRTERQREVLRAIEAVAKKTDLVTLTKVFNECIDDIYTNIDSKDILELLGNIANYRIVDVGGFPTAKMRVSSSIKNCGICEVPKDLEAGVVWLHELLFEEKDYKVTDTVKECAADILKTYNRDGKKANSEDKPENDEPENGEPENAEE